MSRLHLLSGVAASVFAIALPAFADPAQDEIIVTASRIDQPGYSVGGSYSIITGEELAQRQSQFVSDALRAVPGLAVNQGGQPGSLTQLRIRGAESNMTLVLIDGVKVNAPADFGNDFDFGNLVALDIDRIEVLRGAQSSIWGANAIGGVVNIVTREPERGLHGLLSFEGGSYDTTDTKARLSYGAEKFGVSLGGSAFYTHGFSQADVKAGFAHERDADRNGSANGRIRLMPADNLTITLDGRYINSKLDTDSIPPFDSDDVQHLNERWGNANINWKLFGGHVENITTASVMDIKSDSGSADNGFFANRGSKEIYSDQVNLFADSAFLLPVKHRLSVLFEYERDAGASQFVSPFFASPPNLNRVTENRGLVAEYSIGIADRLFLSGSIRHDDNNQFADTDTYRGTLAYRIPAWGTRFHGSYGTGIENPSFFELFGSSPNFFSNSSLHPESSRSIDFGVEQTFFAKRLKIDATIFANRINNRIATSIFTVVPPPAGSPPGTPSTTIFTSTNIAGDTNIKGLELTASALVTSHITLDLSYTAMDTQSPAGPELTRRPRNSGSAYLNYAMPQWRANLNLGIAYQGRSRDQDFNSFPAPFVDLRGYTLLTLAGSYDVTDYLQLHARIENGLDQHYEQVLYYGAPRISAFGGITLKFGG